MVGQGLVVTESHRRLDTRFHFTPAWFGGDGKGRCRRVMSKQSLYATRIACIEQGVLNDPAPVAAAAKVLVKLAVPFAT